MWEKRWLSRLVWICLTIAFSSLSAKDVSDEEAMIAAGKWLNANSAFWCSDVQAKPVSVKRMTDDAGMPLPLWFVSLSPAGYIVFSSDDTLPPVVAFSDKGDLSKTKVKNLSDPLSELLFRQGEIFQKELAIEKTRGDSFAAENMASWNALLARTRADSIEPGTIIRSPMLETEWNQSAPYNALCPNSDSSAGRAVTGCVAVAISQILKFHEWPPAGIGSKEDKDNTGDVKATINADFSYPYNWHTIPNRVDAVLSTAEVLPLARVLLESGAMAGADYEISETSASSSSFISLFSQYLRFSSDIQYGDTQSGNYGYTSVATLYSRIRTDMVDGRPAIVSFSKPYGHAFVADGLGTAGGKDYYHFNYGWGGLYNGWYLLTDGESSTVVDSATTNILPKAIPVFKPISVEQESSFMLEWYFPKRIEAEAFRLSKNTGTRAAIPIIDTIPGTARSYNLTGQAGTATYTLAAKVNGKWQTASDGVTISVKTAPVAMPTIAMESVLKSIDGASATTTITSSTTLKSLAVTSSRPDILPAKGISISGSGASRTVKLTPSAGKIGNVLLYVTATDNVGNVVKNTAILSVLKLEELVWHTSLDAALAAAGEGQFVLLVAGNSQEDGNVDYFLNTVCETDDVKLILLENYSLWLCPDLSSSSWKAYGVKGAYCPPVVAIIDKSKALVRNHAGFMGQYKAKEFLSLQNPYPSMEGELTELSDAMSIAKGDGISFYTAETPWVLQNEIYKSAPSAMKSGTISDMESSVMIGKVKGPGTLSFYWKASTEELYDVMEFGIDGIDKAVISGATDWQKKEYTVSGKGEHYFTWAYTKDLMDGGNDECGWVDDVVWTPFEPNPVAVDLEIGWNLVAITLELDDNAVNLLLSSRAILFDLGHKAYRRAFAEDIVPGAALWVFTKEPREIVLHGYDVDDWKLEPSKGWNLVGAIKNVAKREWSKNISAVKEWNGSGYKDVDNMEKGKAYWVYGK